MTNHSKASFKICKEIEGRYKVTCRLTRIHVEVCQRLKDSYTLIETFIIRRREENKQTIVLLNQLAAPVRLA